MKIEQQSRRANKAKQCKRSQSDSLPFSWNKYAFYLFKCFSMKLRLCECASVCVCGTFYCTQSLKNNLLQKLHLQRPATYYVICMQFLCVCVYICAVACLPISHIEECGNFIAFTLNCNYHKVFLVFVVFLFKVISFIFGYLLATKGWNSITL